MNDEPLRLHEDVFYHYFKPYRHLAAEYAIWGGLGLETFGSDLALASQLPSENVWTVLEGENDEQWIVPGLRIVNRVCYLVTEIQHNEAEIEFEIKNAPDTICEAELAQQLEKLARLNRGRS